LVHRLCRGRHLNLVIRGCTVVVIALLQDAVVI
jgi:hypothetical protein